MLPHEGYNMLYAQGMGDESYSVGYIGATIPIRESYKLI